MSNEDKRELKNTFMAAFGHHPDMVISEAMAVAIRRHKTFMPTLPEFAECIRRAEMILNSRAIDEVHRRQRELELSAPDAVEKAKEWEDVLIWAGFTKEAAHETAFYGIPKDRLPEEMV